MSRPAVFIDRDGTLIDNHGYLGDPALVKLLPGVKMALSSLAARGFQLVLITNQSAVARGMFTCADVEAVNRKTNELVGGLLDQCYYCPHHPEIGSPPYRKICSCRKPENGMITRAIKELDLAAAASYCIGDQARDLETCNQLPIQTILVLTGKGSSAAQQMKLEPDHTCADLSAAAEWILKQPTGQGK